MNPDIIRAVAILVNDNGQVLLSKDKGSDKWQALGGKIEKGENSVETIHREMLEELSVEVNVDPNIFAESPIFQAGNDPDKTVKLIYHFCKLLGEPKLIENVEELCWFSRKDFESGKYFFPESTLKFLLPKLISENILK
jgi:8-oxo-dGTP pyrophosphatase MutT (NUDIX family)